jgi:hypothetical protein
MAGAMAQIVGCLCGKYKDLSSYPRTTLALLKKEHVVNLVREVRVGFSEKLSLKE